MIKRLLTLCAFVCAASMAVAQDGFGLWTSAEVTKKIRRGFNASVEADFRTCNNMKNVDRWDFGASLSYRLCPYLKVAAGYTFQYKYIPSHVKVDYDEGFTLDGGRYSVESKWYAPYWLARHRFHIDLTGEYVWRRFTFALRERYQLRHECEESTRRVKSDLFYSTVYDEAAGGYPYAGQEVTGTDQKIYEAENKSILRSRLTVEYNIPKCKFDPYASVELFNSLNKSGSLQKVRWTAGIAYKMTKQSTFDFSYRIQHNSDEDDSNLYAVGVGYSYKF